MLDVPLIYSSLVYTLLHYKMASRTPRSRDSFHFGSAQTDNGLSNNAQKGNLNKNLAKYARCTGKKRNTQSTV